MAVRQDTRGRRPSSHGLSKGEGIITSMKKYSIYLLEQILIYFFWTFWTGLTSSTNSCPWYKINAWKTRKRCIDFLFFRTQPSLVPQDSELRRRQSHFSDFWEPIWFHIVRDHELYSMSFGKMLVVEAILHSENVENWKSDMQTTYFNSNKRISVFSFFPRSTVRSESSRFTQFPKCSISPPRVICASTTLFLECRKLPVLNEFSDNLSVSQANWFVWKTIGWIGRWRRLSVGSMENHQSRRWWTHWLSVLKWSRTEIRELNQV